MFEIVERILAALIILALLTLLIILAFPVPPRDTVAPAPSGETKQAERTDPAPKGSLPPASAPAPKVEPAPTPAPKVEPAPAPAPEPKASDPAPAPKTDAQQTPEPKAEPPAPRKVVDRIPPSSAAPAPVVVSNDPKRPPVTVRAKNQTERVVYSREEKVSRYRRRATVAARREREAVTRGWREPVFVGECEDEDCDCCGGDCGKRSRPYWAEPRRQRWAQAPAGTCPY